MGGCKSQKETRSQLMCCSKIKGIKENDLMPSFKVTWTWLTIQENSFEAKSVHLLMKTERSHCVRRHTLIINTDREEKLPNPWQNLPIVFLSVIFLDKNIYL